MKGKTHSTDKIRAENIRYFPVTNRPMPQMLFSTVFLLGLKLTSVRTISSWFLIVLISIEDRLNHVSQSITHIENKLDVITPLA